MSPGGCSVLQVKMDFHFLDTVLDFIAQLYMVVMNGVELYMHVVLSGIELNISNICRWIHLNALLPPHFRQIMYIFNTKEAKLPKCQTQVALQETFRNVLLWTYFGWYQKGFELQYPALPTVLHVWHLIFTQPSVKQYSMILLNPDCTLHLDCAWRTSTQNEF